MLKDFFRKQHRYATIPSQDVKREIPEGIMQKCPHCGTISYAKELEKNLKVCKSCNYHFSLSAPERIAVTVDEGRFFEYDADLKSLDPLEFPDYKNKLRKDMEKTGLNEAVVTGEGTIGGYPVVIGVMDSRFRMGSMGSRRRRKNRPERWNGPRRSGILLFSFPPPAGPGCRKGFSP